MVSKHLTPEQLIWWVKEDATDWNTFYCFLEKQAKVACEVQVLWNICFGSPTPAKDSSCEEVESSPTPAEDSWDAKPAEDSSEAALDLGSSLHCAVHFIRLVSFIKALDVSAAGTKKSSSTGLRSSNPRRRRKAKKTSILPIAAEEEALT